MVGKWLRIYCNSTIIEGKVTEDGNQWRKWGVSLEMSGIDLSEHLQYVQYTLHSSFGIPPIIFRTPPYLLQREGWGEFDLGISLYFKDPLIPSPQTFTFDLNFKKPKYYKIKKIMLEAESEFMLESEDEEPELIFERPSPSSSSRRRRHRTSSVSPPPPGPSRGKTCIKMPKKRRITKQSADKYHNKDLQQNQQDQQKPTEGQNQHLSQNKHGAAAAAAAAARRSPNYILIPENDLNPLLDTEEIDLAELKALMEALDEPNLRRAYAIMRSFNGNVVEEIMKSIDGYYLLDICCASPDFVNKLWEFVIDVELEKCKETSQLSENTMEHTSHL